MMYIQRHIQIHWNKNSRKLHQLDWRAAETCEHTCWYPGQDKNVSRPDMAKLCPNAH